MQLSAECDSCSWQFQLAEWAAQGENFSHMFMNVTTYLKNDLVNGLIGCDLIPIGYGKLLELKFSNISVDTPLLGWTARHGIKFND
jgi:hypothetical protein